MSNKTQLQTNNTALDGYIARINAAKEVAASLPDVGGGGSSEDLEALEVLCDWSILTDSYSIPTICIGNYHPSYYMHCTVHGGIGDTPFYSTEDEDIYPENGNIVIEPNGMLELSFDNAFSYLEGVYVDEVRWTRDGTI